MGKYTIHGSYGQGCHTKKRASLYFSLGGARLAVGREGSGGIWRVYSKFNSPSTWLNAIFRRNPGNNKNISNKTNNSSSNNIIKAFPSWTFLSCCISWNHPPHFEKIGICHLCVFFWFFCSGWEAVIRGKNVKPIKPLNDWTMWTPLSNLAHVSRQVWLKKR